MKFSLDLRRVLIGDRGVGEFAALSESRRQIPVFAIQPDQVRLFERIAHSAAVAVVMHAKTST